MHCAPESAPVPPPRRRDSCKPPLRFGIFGEPLIACSILSFGMPLLHSSGFSCIVSCFGRVATILFNSRFGSERKISQPSSGFRIQSRYTIGAYGSYSYRRKMPHLNCRNVSDAKNLRGRASQRQTERAAQEVVSVDSVQFRIAGRIPRSLDYLRDARRLAIKRLIASILARGIGLFATIASAIRRSSVRSTSASFQMHTPVFPACHFSDADFSLVRSNIFAKTSQFTTSRASVNKLTRRPASLTSVFMKSRKEQRPTNLNGLPGLVKTDSKIVRAIFLMI